MVLTEGDGTHTVEFSPDRRFFVDTWSRVDLPPVTELRRSRRWQTGLQTGRRRCHAHLLATGWKPPERFVAKGRDGETDIYGVICRPEEFRPAQEISGHRGHLRRAAGFVRAKAFHRVLSLGSDWPNCGFIVVQIDGMGTSNRSKKFHDVCWKNLGDAGFPDRILWIKAAAAKHPWYGFDARRHLRHLGRRAERAARRCWPTAISTRWPSPTRGCHDNRMDKIWWNEQWMGWPVGPQYAEQSNVTNAHKLQGKLLLMVGEMDHNVDPSRTMQVVNALIKANKDFDLLVVPGAGHGRGRHPTARGGSMISLFGICWGWSRGG